MVQGNPTPGDEAPGATPEGEEGVSPDDVEVERINDSKLSSMSDKQDDIE